MKQRVTLELYQHTRTGWRRIASLPDCDDELCDLIKKKYEESKFPKFRIRLITELF